MTVGSFLLLDFSDVIEKEALVPLRSDERPPDPPEDLPFLLFSKICFTYASQTQA
ncbi:MAG: hypothetical protein PWQ38_740 [Proteiniphilum sp.]|nr:hypothetical protein [Proteiniphilum sp.]